MIVLPVVVKCSTLNCDAEEVFEIDFDDISLDLNAHKISFHVPLYDKGWKEEMVLGYRFGDTDTYHWCPECKKDKK